MSSLSADATPPSGLQALERGDSSYHMRGARGASASHVPLPFERGAGAVRGGAEKDGAFATQRPQRRSALRGGRVCVRVPICGERAGLAA